MGIGGRWSGNRWWEMKWNWVGGRAGKEKEEKGREMKGEEGGRGKGMNTSASVPSVDT